MCCTVSTGYGRLKCDALVGSLRMLGDIQGTDSVVARKLARSELNSLTFCNSPFLGGRSDCEPTLSFPAAKGADVWCTILSILSLKLGFVKHLGHSLQITLVAP